MDYSYPTIKKMLDDVIIDLGYSLDSEPEEVKETDSQPKMSRVDILGKIASGEINVIQAAELLKKIK
jgi:hypothetical protein